VNADTIATINVVLVEKPAGANQHEMEVIHSRGLDNPVNLARLILKKEYIYKQIITEGPRQKTTPLINTPLITTGGLADNHSLITTGPSRQPLHSYNRGPCR
jgi:hypothetical protein